MFRFLVSSRKGRRSKCPPSMASTRDDGLCARDPWGGGMHPLLVKWRGIAQNRQKMHALAFRYFQRKNTAFMMCIIAISCVSGIGEIVLSAMNAQECPTRIYYTIAAGLLSVVSATMGAAYNALSLGKKEAAHEMYGTKYEELVHDINAEAAISELDSSSKNQVEFIRKINLSFHSIMEHAPAIPRSIEKNGRI